MKQKKNSKEVAVNWDLWYHVVSDVLDGYYKKHPYDKSVWLSNISHKCKQAMTELGMSKQVVGKHVLGLAACIEEYLAVHGYDMAVEKKSGAYRYHGIKAGAATPAKPVVQQLDQNKELASDIRATLERVADIESGIMALNTSVNDIRKDIDEFRSHGANYSDGCEPSTVEERIPCDIKVMINNLVKEARCCMNPCLQDSIDKLEKYKAAIIVASNIAEYIGILKREATSKSRVNELVKRFAIDSDAASAVLEMPLDSLLNVAGLNKSLSIYQGYRDHVDRFNNLAQTLLGDDYNDESNS